MFYETTKQSSTVCDFLQMHTRHRSVAITFMTMLVITIFGALSTQAIAQAKTTNQGKAAAKSAASDSAKRMDIALDLLTHSQRVVKLYYQTVLDVQADKTRAKISESVAIISTDIDKLRKEPLTPLATAALNEVDTIWGSMIRPLSGAPSKAGAEALIAPNESMLAALEKLVQELAKNSKSAQSEVLILVSNQAALSQRIARNYFAHALGLSGNPGARLTSLMSRFVSVEEELQAFAGEDPKLKNDLDLIKVQVVFFKNIAERYSSASKVDHVAMGNVSGRLLEAFGRIEAELSK